MESSWASMVFISVFRYLRFASWVSLRSFECSKAIVEVLNKIMSRVILGGQSW